MRYQLNSERNPVLTMRLRRSIYQDIELISEEEFLSTAPPELTQDSNPHARMINRLKFEHQERLR
jgi:Fms-interacting protein/Thoc5